MNVIQLSDTSKAKPLSEVAKSLNLHPQFASPGELQQTVLLLSKHIDELRFRLSLVEAQLRRRWWHAFWRARP